MSHISNDNICGDVIRTVQTKIPWKQRRKRFLPTEELRKGFKDETAFGLGLETW